MTMNMLSIQNTILSGKTSLSKQCRPRSYATGSTLFATYPQFLDTSSGSEMHLLKTKDKNDMELWCPIS